MMGIFKNEEEDEEASGGETPATSGARVVPLLPLRDIVVFPYMVVPLFVGRTRSIQALEVIKLIMGVGETLTGRMLLIDALTMDFREIKIRRNPDCKLCGDDPEVTELIDYDIFCGILPPGATEVPEQSVKQPASTVSAD